MRVAWFEIHIPPTDILESYYNDGMTLPPFPRTDYRGEVIGTVRTWGETRLVVALDTKQVVEVALDKVKVIP